MNWNKFIKALLTGTCWYTGLWILCILLNNTYKPPRLDSTDILVTIFILCYAFKNGMEENIKNS